MRNINELLRQHSSSANTSGGPARVCGSVGNVLELSGDTASASSEGADLGI